MLYTLAVTLLAAAQQSGSRAPLQQPIAQVGIKGNLPDGAMILLDTKTSPIGFSYAGLTVEASADGRAWMTMAPMPTGRSYLAAAALDDRLYAVGGFNGAFLSTIEEYIPATDSWATRTPMPTPRRGLAAVAINGRILAIGGEAGAYLATVEEFDPSTNSWLSRAPMPTARAYFGAAVLNGLVYAVGGYAGSIALGTVERFDPALDSWTTLTPMPTPRSDFATATRAGRLYAMGGHPPGDAVGAVEVYDPANGHWEAEAPGPSLYGLAAAATEDFVYTFGGAATGVVGEYNGTTNVWRPVAPLPTPRQGLAAALVGDCIYVCGGDVTWPGTAPMDVMERFEPSRRLFVHVKD